MDPKSVYLSRPWLKFYEPGVPAEPEVPLKSVPQSFDEATAKFAAKNLLNPKIERTYGEDSNLIYSTYRKGMSFGVAFSYDF